MSICPSNAIAAGANPGKTMFPNLAGRDPQLVDDTVRGELETAGILTGTENRKTNGNYMEAEWIRKTAGEVGCAIMAAKHRWSFTRAWYYYIAKGPGIPPDIAEEFHKTWGTQCRVDGHCGCPSPLEWEVGFAVGMYHIDTQEGLNAFVKMLASVHKPKVEADACG